MRSSSIFRVGVGLTLATVWVGSVALPTELRAQTKKIQKTKPEIKKIQKGTVKAKPAKPKTVHEKPDKSAAAGLDERFAIRKTKLVAVPFSKEFSHIEDKAPTINGPTFLGFRWSTEEQGVDSAIWRVTGKPHLPGEPWEAYASGELSSVPPPGSRYEFSIDFRPFTPAQAPKKPYFLRYYVYISPIDTATDEERAQSTVVEVTYREPGPPTQFTENMAPGDTAAASIVRDVAQKLADQFGIGDPLGPVVDNSQGLRAWGLYDSPDGPVSIEVQEGMVESQKGAGGGGPIIYIAVPQKGKPNPVAYHWFKYTYALGGLTPVLDDQYPPPSKKIPVLTELRDWCHDDTYDVEALKADDDPPHWSPILVKTNYSGWGTITDIHRRFQWELVQETAKDKLERHRRGVLETDPEELGERALDGWPPTTLRGIVKNAGFPSGDLGVDHATGYIGDPWWIYPGLEDEAHTGGLGSMCDPSTFPGMDWDMHVKPDPAYRYLASWTRDTLNVEIEHFAVPSFFRPRSGEWLQTQGRWAVDCGHSTGPHDDYYTEIHPPELLASTRPGDGAFQSLVKVILTGAWTGGKRSFVANPPARPSATSVLKWAVDEDWAKAASISVKTVPENNPNHLVVTLAKGSGFKPITLHSDGRVSMRRQGWRGWVRVWWDETLSSIEGAVTADGGPAHGAHMHYRDARISNSTWRRSPIAANGAYRIPGVARHGEYWLRPAGSTWDFHDVPVKVLIDQQVVRQNFTGTKAPIRVSAHEIRRAAEVAPVFRDRDDAIYNLGRFSKAATTIKPGTLDTLQEASNDDLRTEIGKGQMLPGSGLASAFNTVRSMVFSVQEPPRTMGVLLNQMGYPEEGVVAVHLQGLADWEGEPIASLEEAYTAESDDGETQITIDGYTTPGVAGATVAARLLLGNDAVSYRVAAKATAQTDGSGVAVFNLRAGGHPEEATVEIEVTENPYNPWFKPKIRTNNYHFYPAVSRGDIPPPVQTGSGFMKIRPHREAYKLTGVKTTVTTEAVQSAVGSFGERQRFGEASVRRATKLRATPGIAPKSRSETIKVRAIKKRATLVPQR
ncbi:MAG: hypothetical protein ACE5GX_09060 [Thermoanaerobaculia bacterium]